MLADLDRAGHLAVAAAGQAVEVVGAVLADEDRPRLGRADCPGACTGAKWKTCCWVTVSGGSSTTPSSSGAIHAPAATAITGAVKVPLSVCATAPSPAGVASSRVTGVPNLMSAPLAAASLSMAAIALSGSRTPASAWYITWPAPVKSKYGQRSAAASGSSSSAGTPQLVSTSCSCSGLRVRAEVKAAGQREQRLACLVLELPPKLSRALPVSRTYSSSG